MSVTTHSVATPGTPVPGALPLLDRLEGSGVDRVEITATLHGGRWHVDGWWEGQHPDMPQTTDTRTSGHFDGHASIEDVVALIAEDADAGNEDIIEEVLS